MNERDIVKIMQEMIDAGLPVTEFSPTEGGGFDWVFSRGITEEEQKIALEISKKYINTEYSFS